MNARKLSALGFVGVLVALGILTYFGNRLLFLVFVPLTVFTLAYHATFVCRRCTNFACALNGKSPDCLFGQKRNADEESVETTFSDINTGREGFLPLVPSLALGMIGTAQYSLYALLGLLAISGGLFAIYSRVTCAYCTNDCPNNKNQAYRQWKQTTRQIISG